MPGRKPAIRLACPTMLVLLLPVLSACAQDVDPDPEARVAATAEAARKDPRFLNEVKAHLREWDRDGSGSLSMDEVELAVHNPAVKGNAAAAATALRRAMRAAMKVNKDLPPVTAESIAAPPPAGTKRPAYESMYARALSRIESRPRVLFTDGAPKVDSVRQGRLGDCFLLVSLGVCAECQPDRLRSMMSPRDEKTVRVTFGDGRSLDIPAPTDAEVALGASTADTGDWANVYEKAVGTMMMKDPKTRKAVTPLALIGGGGTPSVPLSILTGHKVRRYPCAPYRKTKDAAGVSTADLEPLRKVLKDAFAERRLVVGGRGKKQPDSLVVPGLYFNHSYGVLGYDEKTDVVTFWNPMGNTFKPKGPDGLAHGYATTHGRFRAPLREAVMWFGSFSVETHEPTSRS